MNRQSRGFPCLSYLSLTVVGWLLLILLYLPNPNNWYQTDHGIRLAPPDPSVATDHKSDDASWLIPLTSEESALLPEKLITVVGLESSGTTFTAMTLADALGLQKDLSPPLPQETMAQGYSNAFGATGNDTTRYYQTAVQHVSLPWGASCNTYPDTVVRQGAAPVVYPAPCMALLRSRQRDDPEMAPPGMNTTKPGTVGHSCRGFFDTDAVDRNFNYRRYILNLTSHVDWYVRRGVDVHLVMVARDATISFQARHQLHCRDAALEAAEEDLSMQVLEQVLDSPYNNDWKGDDVRRRLAEFHARHLATSRSTMSSSRVLLVSYELLNRFQHVYLAMILQALDIQAPAQFYRSVAFVDGNRKYVQRNSSGSTNTTPETKSDPPT